MDDFVGSGRSPANNIEAGFAASGKLVLTMADFAIDIGGEHSFVLRNNSESVLFINQVERYEVDIASFVEGASTVVFDFIYTPDLSGTSEIPIAEGNVYAISDQGIAINLEPEFFDFAELVDFDVDASSNKPIVVAKLSASYFVANQATSIIQESVQKGFSIPYSLGPGQEIVLHMKNEIGIAPGINTTVRLVLTGYAL